MGQKRWHGASRPHPNKLGGFRSQKIAKGDILVQSPFFDPDMSS